MQKAHVSHPRFLYKKDNSKNKIILRKHEPFTLLKLDSRPGFYGTVSQVQHSGDRPSST